jgi:mannose-6-phosphate isomerase-like protein (cupin superfamily)
MGQGGREITNPVTGERIRFLHTADETAGQVLIFDLFLRPAGVVAGFPHRHRPTERFELRQGALQVWIAGKGTLRARPGDVVEVPSHRTHVVANGGTTEAWARVEVRPAGTMEELFREAFALADPRSLRRANPRRLAALFEDNEMRFPLLPEFLQSALLRSLGNGANAARAGAPGPR